MERKGYVYILASGKKGTLYIGVTSNLITRAQKHKAGYYPHSFSQKYNTHLLVYYEETGSIKSALAREKQLKNWHREWKINLIEKNNPDWKDLTPAIMEVDPETSSG